MEEVNVQIQPFQNKKASGVASPAGELDDTQKFKFADVAKVTYLG